MERVTGICLGINDSSLIVTVISGNEYIGIKGYNPSIQVIFKEREQAIEWAGRSVAIELEKEKLVYREGNEFKSVRVEDCDIKCITEDEMNDEIEVYKNKLGVKE